MGQSVFYTTRDIWQAAALDCYGIPFRGAHLHDDGRVSWDFDNAGDRAWQTGVEFRSSDVMVVPVQAFRTSYRKMSRAADTARHEGYTYEHHPD